METTHNAQASSGSSELLKALKAWFWEADGFAGEIYSFAELHAVTFQMAVEYFDGGGQEHNLSYTQLHQEFRQRFEIPLEAFLSSHRATMHDMREAFAGAAEDREADVMVAVLLSMADYEPWFRAMLALAREQVQEQQDRAVTEAEETAQLPQGWTAYRDEHGQDFFANADTGETSWDRPGLRGGGAVQAREIPTTAEDADFM
eukprot:TRINITY_DN70714_c0_g1_i1.p1 TRINITY_DN70714_c0_g1~~TRINITY_DN70714_c0_g1_i1.p1  ORF type:complete len:203 (+),score=45.95 TRINITY_DN70714_c0_g1_i1:117-725(+)